MTDVDGVERTGREDKIGFHSGLVIEEVIGSDANQLQVWF